MKKLIISVFCVVLFSILITNFSLNSKKNNDVHTKLNALVSMAHANSESGGGWLWKSNQTNTSCTIEKTIRIITAIGEYEYTETVQGIWVSCVDGWSLCISYCKV